LTERDREAARLNFLSDDPANCPGYHAGLVPKLLVIASE